MDGWPAQNNDGRKRWKPRASPPVHSITYHARHGLHVAHKKPSRIKAFERCACFVQSRSHGRVLKAVILPFGLFNVGLDLYPLKLSPDPNFRPASSATSITSRPPSVLPQYTMPATTIPPVPHYEPAPVTKEDCEPVPPRNSVLAHLLYSVDWAELPVIDISKAKTPQGRIELGPIVRDAMRNHGFMFVVNHGLTQAEVSVFRVFGQTRVRWLTSSTPE